MPQRVSLLKVFLGWGALCRGFVLCAPQKIGARAFQWLSSVPCSCAGRGGENPVLPVAAGD